MNNNPPVKWKKYMFLPTMGLRSMESIENDIKRYNIKDNAQMFKDIEKEIKASKEFAYVCSFVPPNWAHSTPKYLIKEYADIDKAKNYLQELGPSKFSEVWFFNHSKTDVFGRLSYELDEGFPEFAKPVLETQRIASAEREQKLQLIHDKLNNPYRKRRIFDFALLAKAAGCREFSVQLKLRDSRFLIYDWDKDNDDIVLEKLKGLGE